MSKVVLKRCLRILQRSKQKARENEVPVMLKEFQTEYKEMAESLRSLLDKRREPYGLRSLKRCLKISGQDRLSGWAHQEVRAG